MTSMWEILVPTEKRIKTAQPKLGAGYGPDDYPDALKRWKIKNSYSTRYHRVWDEKVRAITGGLTILTPAKGQWVSPEGELFQERMIPVRIAATREQIDKIIDMTLEFYDQLAVLCYKVSDEVIIRHAVTKPNAVEPDAPKPIEPPRRPQSGRTPPEPWYYS